MDFRKWLAIYVCRHQMKTNLSFTTLERPNSIGWQLYGALLFNLNFLLHAILLFHPTLALTHHTMASYTSTMIPNVSLRSRISSSIWSHYSLLDLILNSITSGYLISHSVCHPSCDIGSSFSCFISHFSSGSGGCAQPNLLGKCSCWTFHSSHIILSMFFCLCTSMSVLHSSYSLTSCFSFIPILTPTWKINSVSPPTNVA